MWLWGSNTKSDENIITELDDVEPLEDEFLVISNTNDYRDLQNQLEIQKQTLTTLESNLLASSSKLESASKLHKKELEFKDRLAEQKEQKIKEIEKKHQELDRAGALKLAQLNEKIASSLRNLEVLTQEKAELQSENTKLSGELENIRVNHSQVFERLETLSKEYKECLITKNQEITDLKVVVQQLEENLREQKRITKEKEAFVSSLTEKNKSESLVSTKQLEVELVSAKQQLNDVQLTLSKTRNELQSVRQTLSSKEREHASEKERLKEDLLQQQNQCKLFQKEIERATKQQEITQRKLALVEEQLKEKDIDLEDLRQQNTQTMNHLDHIQQLLTEERQRSNTQKEENDLRYAAIFEEAKITKDQLERTFSELNSLKEQLVVKDSKLSRIQKEVDELTRQLDTSPNCSEPIESRVKAEVIHIMKQNPNSVPIRCLRAEGCNYPMLEKKKFAAPKEMSLSRFNEHIRQKLQIPTDSPLSVYVETTAPLPSSEILEQLYEICKQPDGFLLLKYSQNSC